MQNLLSVAFLLMLLCACSTKPAQLEQKSPNFIIIFTDDQGFGDLSCYGHPTIRTPHLDQMAEEGQKWTQFYVAAPLCTPSRAALLTGRYPIRNGMTSAEMGVFFPNSTGGLPPGEITIAEVLKQKQYATAAIGKWHLGHLPSFLPTQQGFDYYYGIPYSNDMNVIGDWGEYLDHVDDPGFVADLETYNVPLMENETIIERPANQHTITRRYTEKAIAFVEANRNQPFFIYLAHSMPHIPLFAHSEFKGESKAGLYGDVIEEIDWSVGQILTKLKDLQLDQHTLVVFTSDNGPWLTFRSHGGSAGPLKAGKGTTFEGGQRVPAIFWGPGRVQPGIVTALGTTMDLLPTIAALSGTDTPTDRHLDGFDLSPILKGENSQSQTETFFYWTEAQLFAVRSGKWKLHVRQMQSLTDWGESQVLAEPELYDLEFDPGERYDRAADYPELVDSLQSLFEAHQQEMMLDALPDNLAAMGEEDF